MAVNLKNKNPRFLTKIAAAFLVILCCLIAPTPTQASFLDLLTPASLTSLWQGITCFFGLNCPEPPQTTEITTATGSPAITETTKITTATGSPEATKTT